MKLDLLFVPLSEHDVKRELTLPKMVSQELAEFIGIIIGDGYIYHKKNIFIVGIVGSPKKDAEYFAHIQSLIYRLFNIRTSFKKIGRGLRLVFHSKGVFYFLTSVIGLMYGDGKGEKITIPVIISSNNEIMPGLLRGLFDTDGTIFTSDKIGCPDYPCIELATTSLKLAQQVKKELISLGFRVANIRNYKSKLSKLITYKVSLYGKGNMALWFNKIGFSNPNKQNRLLNIINGLDEI